METAALNAPHPADADPQRPQYHLLPPSGWLNDPNGLIQWGDEYHMFYQHNPAGAFHDLIHWGHAVSTDLAHWRHLPIALAPEPGTIDEDGCWSGCAVNNDGVPTIMYSGASRIGQRPCIATSSDGLLTWQKYAGNPVIAAPPPELDLIEYRDHSIWREDGMWYQLIGVGLRDQGGAALLYRSPNLYDWEYLNPLCVGDVQRREPVWTGSMWECPDFFRLGDRHALTVSVWENRTLYGSAAMVGTYRNFRFTPEVEHILDYGERYFYAPQSFSDAQGRRIIFGWIQEGRTDAVQRASGWSGVMSLPRVLSIGADGGVVMTPVPELAALRGEHIRSAPRSISAGEVVVLAEVAGDALELGVTLMPSSGMCGVEVRRSPDGAETTLIVYDAARGTLSLDRSRASLDESTERATHVAPLRLATNEALELRVFLDHSTIEIFANERVTITSRIYPTRADSTGVAVFADGADAELLTLDAWQMGTAIV